MNNPGEDYVGDLLLGGRPKIGPHLDDSDRLRRLMGLPTGHETPGPAKPKPKRKRKNRTRERIAKASRKRNRR